MKTLVCILTFIFSMSGLFAQQIPVDPEVKTGKLDNGMTYYIRHNALPKERADFYLACNVGAVLEEDYQNGFAHFIEHMAFNGSKHFKGNDVIDYLRKIGVKFGENLNATTSLDETVYRITDVPVIKKEVVDTCLLILHDWAGYLSLEDEEIEKERGVIREEMRMMVNHTHRSKEALLQQIMPDNQYTKRNVIGTEEIIMNFNPDMIRSFYQKWYRPDLQAVIIVGDIDPEMMERKIKSLFSSIPAPVNPAKRIYYPVEDNESIAIGITTDKEMPYAMIDIDYKHDPLPRQEKGTINGIATDYINYIASYMSYNRLLELLNQPVPPFRDGIIRNEQFMQTATAETWQGTIVVRENEFELGMKTLVREMERINRFGFTASEYEIAKLHYLSLLEKEFDQQDNNHYAREYVEHFLKGGYIPGIKTQYEITKEIATQIPLEMVNEYIQELMGEKNIVIRLVAPQKESIHIPTRNQLLAWFAEAKKEELTSYQENIYEKPLLTELPSQGKIINETIEEVFGTTIFTLSNGVKVVIKPTELKKDEILMAATSPGGTSHFPETDPVNIALYNEISNLGGVGEFSNRELTTILAGKNVNVTPVISTTTEGFSGSSNNRDFETMLQLIYLHFTAPRQDSDAFQSFISRKKSTLDEKDIFTVFRDSLRNTAYANKKRHHTLTANDLSYADYPTIMKWRKDRYSDASDFTFVFTGSIEMEKVKEMIARYLGALPTTGREETHMEITDGYHAGRIQNRFNRKMETPQAIVVQIYPVLQEMTLANDIKTDMLAQILDIIFNQKIREERSDVYSISATANPEEYPIGLTQFQINYFTEPGKEDSINETIAQIITEIADNGPQQSDFLKAREFMLMKQQNKEQQNEYWLKVLTDFYARNYNIYTEYVNTLNSISADDIREIARKTLNPENLIEVIMEQIHGQNHSRDNT